jgi:hypothetical protein
LSKSYNNGRSVKKLGIFMWLFNLFLITLHMESEGKSERWMKNEDESILLRALWQGCREG